MKEISQKVLHRFAQYLEIAVSSITAVVIALLIVELVISLVTDPSGLTGTDAMQEFLTSAFSLIIGIEFLKMAVKPTPGNIIETLIFAVSRQVVLDHDMTVTLLGILCVAVLFATKKYLFSQFEESEKIVYRASTQIALVNRISGTRLPLSYGETLSSLISSKLAELYKPPKIGTTVEIGDTALQVIRLGSNDRVSRIEVIKKLG